MLPGERVLLHSFCKHDQGKLAPHWQPTPYIVVCQMNPHQPEYKIRQRGKQDQREQFTTITFNHAHLGLSHILALWLPRRPVNQMR